MLMNVQFQKDKLKKILQSFSIVTKLTIGIFDTSCKEILLCKHQPIFCDVIRNSPQGTEMCLNCDILSLKTAHILKDSHQYRCHAGLIDACSPIIENEQIYGYLLYGQFLDDSSYEEQWQRTKQLCHWHTDKGLLKKHFFELQRLSSDEIKASIEIVKACTSYIILQEVVKSYKKTDAEKIIGYINENFNKDIKLDFISSKLNMSKTKLYNITKNEFNKTPGELIIKKRIDVAKSYLTKTDLCICEISSLVGISDYNYFSRIFKKKESISPSRFRDISRSGTFQKLTDV
ncbi:HTH-type transcriptional activator RhaS [bioreactor metagenome]|uniref:HTH-type transcriptional activator RhaS n=1 Tax=bioreactor metagenome TaxID=1076179 RepID=A0A645BXY4_9ZZZZ